MSSIYPSTLMDSTIEDGFMVSIFIPWLAKEVIQAESALINAIPMIRHPPFKALAYGLNMKLLFSQPKTNQCLMTAVETIVIGSAV